VPTERKVVRLRHNRQHQCAPERARNERRLEQTLNLIAETSAIRSIQKPARNRPPEAPAARRRQMPSSNAVQCASKRQRAADNSRKRFEVADVIARPAQSPQQQHSSIDELLVLHCCVDCCSVDCNMIWRHIIVIVDCRCRGPQASHSSSSSDTPEAVLEPPRDEWHIYRYSSVCSDYPYSTHQKPWIVFYPACEAYCTSGPTQHSSAAFRNVSKLTRMFGEPVVGFDTRRAGRLIGASSRWPTPSCGCFRRFASAMWCV
jgi:hypothetical protein